MSTRYALAERMRLNGASWTEVERATGVAPQSLRKRLGDERWQRLKGIRSPHPSPMTYVRRPAPRDIARAIASVPPDTRDLTARILGDPLPGRSALDRMRADG